MRSPRKKWTLFLLRWGVAIAGIWYVVVNISWRDRALVLDEKNLPVEVRLAAPAEEMDAVISIFDSQTAAVRQVSRAQLVNEADQTHARVIWDGQVREMQLLALDLSDDLNTARRLLVLDPQTGQGRWVDAAKAVDFSVRVPYPLIQAGLRHMLYKAAPLYIWAAIFIFPMTFLITGLRWHALLVALGIQLGLARSFIINMVGAFYNTFMPGSTGGDLLKAYYAAKHTQLRTRAVMSVIVDRAIGLIALIILGGSMAAYQWEEPACQQVATASAVILAALVIGLIVFYIPFLRRAAGLEFLLRRLPMQRQVNKAIDAMELYRRRPLLVLGTILISFPVHITVIISATFAGKAFNLHLDTMDYWVIVPVVVLAGAMPISPQGAGVMEFFAIVLTRRQGCTVAEAFALTMSIRLVQMGWNLVGGIFVFRGGYGAPTESEQEALADEDDAVASQVAASEA